MQSSPLLYGFAALLCITLLMAPAYGTGEGDKRSPVLSGHITIFMCGDVMTGRGIDQVLPHPSDPTLYEPYMRTAEGYVQLAEKLHGEITKPVSFDYIWGDALKELDKVSPDVRMINLETSVTQSDDHWRSKEIHYRMHPDNIPSLTAAGIDICSLANNHVLDWGYTGLIETLDTLKKTHIRSVGAGHNLKEAQAPSIMDVKGKGRVIAISYGAGSSGIPPDWAAKEDTPGVNRLNTLSDETVRLLKIKIRTIKKHVDIVIVSIHWGSNWGYDIQEEHREFAHKLIEEAGVDIIHGHSSHHPRGIEVYKDRLIVYGSGDCLNDYEGIRGYDSYRGDLTLMYFVTVDPSSGNLVALQMKPMQMKKFRLNRATKKDAKWLENILSSEGKRLGTGVELKEDNTLILQWKEQ